MAKRKEGKIGDRIHWVDAGSEASVKITGKVEGWKEGLLVAWVAAWIFCGAVVVYEIFNPYERSIKLVLFVFLIFWAYYLWKVGKTLLYRIYGYELMQIGSGELLLQRKWLGGGSPQRFRIEDLGPLERTKLSPRSWAYTYENLFWVIGGERLAFKHGDRYVAFGLQLDDKQVSALYSFLRKHMLKHRHSGS